MSITRGVYPLIAGTYTPVCLLVLNGTWRILMLAMVYAGAAAAVALKFAWSTPRIRSARRTPFYRAFALDGLHFGSRLFYCRSIRTQPGGRVTTRGESR